MLSQGLGYVFCFAHKNPTGAAVRKVKPQALGGLNPIIQNRNSIKVIFSKRNHIGLAGFNVHACISAVKISFSHLHLPAHLLPGSLFPENAFQTVGKLFLGWIYAKNLCRFKVMQRFTALKPLFAATCYIQHHNSVLIYRVAVYRIK